MGEALVGGAHRGFEIAEFAIREGEREQERGAPAVVEAVGQGARLLEIAKRPLWLVLARLDHRQGDERPNVEVGFDDLTGGHLVEQPSEQAACLVRLLQFVQPEGRPVASPGGVDRAAMAERRRRACSHRSRDTIGAWCSA